MTKTIVFMVDDAHAKVVPLKPEEDTDAERKFKLFFLACMYRQDKDNGFMTEMLGWLKTLTEDDIKKRTH